jgi:hypothetical protein
MGVDLVGALYRGLQSYAAILQTNGDLAASTRCRESSTPYRDRIETDWWDEKAGLYHTHYTNDRQFGKAEGETFLLWFDVLQDTTRKKKTIGHLLTMDLNVENLSYLPLQYYRNGYWSQAHDLILHLADPATARREYPEVSYGVIEAMVQGLIGVDANAVTRTVSTLYRSDNKASAQLTGLPVFNTTLTVTHFGSTRSAIVNTGKHPFIWRARFSGDYKEAIVNSSLAGKGLPGKLRGSKLNQEKDRDGHLISWLEMEVAPGKKLNVRVR